MINKNIFRGYDIRGIYPTDLNEEAAELIGKGFASLMKQKGETHIIVGRDVRLSSDAIFDALTKGIIQTGMNVVNIGVCMTPMTYFAREILKIKPSIMITASHNPKEYNGLKICGLGEDTIYGEEIQELRRFVEDGNFENSEILGEIENKDITETYIDYIVDRVKLGNRKLKVAVDCGSGVASLYIKPFFEKLGVDIISICDTPDGNFPIHHPDPSQEKNMLDFEKIVARYKCDLGIAFDGDADRIICFDENGKILFGDEFMIIIWRDLMKNHPNAEGILDVKCTQSLYEEIEKLGGKARFVKVGSPFIKNEIRKNNLIFAGEYAGHIYFNDDYFGFDDSFYSAARILKILSNTDKKMSELLEGVTKYIGTPEKFVVVPDEKKNEVVQEVKKDFLKEGYQVIDVDGARILFDDGWGLVRCSNTEPKLTVKAEAKTEESVENIMKKIQEAISKFL